MCVSREGGREREQEDILLTGTGAAAIGFRSHPGVEIGAGGSSLLFVCVLAGESSFKRYHTMPEVFGACDYVHSSNGKRSQQSISRGCY